MRREAKLLLKKATDSLLLSVDQFNKPFDTGRVEAVLILLDHSLEMLLKAAIVERGGRIRDTKGSNAYGFDKCLRIAFSGGDVTFLTVEQVISLQTINSLRDAAQHYLLEISEEQLYVVIQTGVSAFGAILKAVFKAELFDVLPRRVLPVSTVPPDTIEAFFEREVDAVRQLFQPGRRKRTEAMARLRPLAIMDNAIQGITAQPSDRDLRRIGKALVRGLDWAQLFQGVAAIEISSTGFGPSLEIHWTKKEGIPIHTVPEGTPGAGVVAVRRVNELDFYNMGLTDLSERVQLTCPRCLAVIRHLGLQEDPDCFKLIVIGRQEHKRYSQKALACINEALPDLDLDEVWRLHRPRRRTNP